MSDSSVIEVEAPENVEMGGKIASIKLVQAPLWKKIIRYFLYFITIFIMWLFKYWVMKLRIKLSYIDGNIDNATEIIVYGADRNVEVVKMQEEKTTNGMLKVFYYRLFKYSYNPQTQTFQPCQFRIDRLTLNDIHKTYGEGLSEDSVKDNAVYYGKNQTDIPRKSCLRLLVEEVLSPFYIFQVYSFVVWAFDEYLVYAGVIFIFSVVSIALTLVETIQTTTKLRKMSYYEIPVKVYRKINGEQKKMEINSSELVPGDVMEIPEGVYMPCDAILLNGTTIMNESMLTGESIPVVKNSLPYNDIYYNPKEDKQFTLFAGTKTIQARYYSGNAVLGLVTLTGFTTVKGELIRTMLFPKPSDFKFYKDSFRFILILAVIAFLGFLIDLPAWINNFKDEKDKTEFYTLIIIKASEIITVTVPPALPTCMQIGVSVALSKLKKKHTYCISPNKINEAGRINVMCFDKTGTLTEDGLDLLGVRPVFFDKNTNKLSFARLVRKMPKLAPVIPEAIRQAELKNYITASQKSGTSSNKPTIYEKTKMFPAEQMLESMACCHGLTMVKDELIGDPLDIKMYEATGWEFEENTDQKYDELVSAVVKPKGSDETKEIGIIRKFEFQSKLQRMSVIVKNLSEAGFKMHIKGSPEKIRELCKNSSIPSNFHSILSKYTENGYRVLACATKTLSLNYKKIMSSKREDLEGNYTFTGFIIMENKLKDVTTDIIEQLHSAKIKTVMVTGDNVLTAISVARQCGIVPHGQRIFLGDVAEKKVNGKNIIQWKDFEFSENTLNEELEPELEYEEGHNLHGSTVRRTSGEQKRRKSSGGSGGRRNSGGIKRSLIHEDNDPEDEDDDMSYDGSADEHHSNGHTKDALDPLDDSDPPFFDMWDDVPYTIAVTGKAFSIIMSEVNKNNPAYKHILNKLLRKCSVFARMHPDEKALMIQHMMTVRKNIVGMCGDGANDCGALKTANVGVSLSEAEASIAAPFTSKIQDISCIPRLLREGRAALATSFQCFKYMALYSVIQFTSVTILYFYLIDLTNWHYYHIDILIILPLSAAMAMSGTWPHLSSQKPTGRLVSVNILGSVIGQAVIQIYFQLFTYLKMRSEDWYDFQKSNCVGNFDTGAVCWDNTTLYLLSIYQYVIVALAFMVGKPFRTPFWTNCWFTISFLLLLTLNLLVTFNPFNWRIVWDPFWGGEWPFPHGSNWHRKIFLIVVINSICTLLWERLVVTWVSVRWKAYRDKKEQAKIVEESKYVPPKLVIEEAPENQEQSIIEEQKEQEQEIQYQKS